MKKFSSQWRVQKQVMLERIGKTENTLEHPEMKELAQILKSNELGLTDVGGKAEKLAKLSTGYVDGLYRLSETLVDFSRTVGGYTVEKGLAAQSLDDTAQTIRKLADIQQELTQAINAQVNSVRSFVKDEIAAARQLKKKYDTSRAELQTVLAELAAVQGKSKTDFKKLTEVEQRKEAAEESFKAVSNEALGVMSETHKAADVRAIAANLALWDGLRNFFAQGQTMVAAAAATFDGYAGGLPKLKEELASMKATRAKSGRPVLSQGLKQRSSTIFGLPLETVVEREGTPVPRFVRYTCDWLLQRGGQVEGIFRISPMAESLRTFKAVVDRGNDRPDYPDAHVAAGMLKQYLRDLPVPLLTHVLYADFLAASKNNCDEPLPVRAAAIKPIVDQLPEPAYRTLGLLLQLLHRLSWHEEKTKMGSTNLAVVVAPNILYTENVDPFSMVEQMSDANVCVTLLVQAFPLLFPELHLFPLVERNDLPALRAVPSALVDYSLRDRDSNSLLHVAARAAADPDLVAHLLAVADLPVDVRNAAAETPLMLAMVDDAQHIATARALLEAGADPLLVDVNGLSALDRSRTLSFDFSAQVFCSKQTTDSPSPTDSSSSTSSSSSSSSSSSPPPSPSSASPASPAGGWKRVVSTPAGQRPASGTRSSIGADGDALARPQLPSTAPPAAPTIAAASAGTSSNDHDASQSSSAADSSASSSSSEPAPGPSSSTPMLAISQTDLDEFCPSFEPPPPMFEESTLNLLISAALAFTVESSKPLGNVTGDSPVFLALKNLGAQYQKTSSELLRLSKLVEQSSQANAESVMQRGGSLPALIKSVIGGIQAYSKSKDAASRQALGQALLRFIEPAAALLQLFEKCGLSAVMKAQKDLVDALHQLLALLQSASDGDEIRRAVEAVASCANLLVFSIRRRALTLPADDTSAQASLFDSCVAIENNVNELLKAAVDAQARDLAQLKLQTRAVFFEFPQILSALAAGYPQRCFDRANAAAAYASGVPKIDALAARLQACSNSAEIAALLPALAALSAAVARLAAAGDADAAAVSELAALMNSLAVQTVAEITRMSKECADDRGLSRHFSLLADGLRFHAVNVEASAAAHLARLMAAADDAGADMSLSAALCCFFDYYSEIANTFVLVYSFDN